MPLLQVLVGARQVGKTVAAAQVEKRLGWPSVVASADAPLPQPPEWIETQWRVARAKAAATKTRGHPLDGELHPRWPARRPFPAAGAL